MIYLIHPGSPANNQNAFFYYPTHGLSTAPADITSIRSSLLRTVHRYQQHHWVVKLPSWGNLYVSIVWEGCSSYKICNWTTLEYIHLIIHIMRFGPYKLREFYQRWMKQTYKIRPVGFFYFYSKIKNTGEIRENI